MPANNVKITKKKLKKKKLSTKMADTTNVTASLKEINEETIKCKCKEIGKPLTEIMTRLEVIGDDVTKLKGLEAKLTKVIESTDKPELK